MSMPADWFFCTTMRLSPADTHAYLDTLAVLRRPDPELPDVLDAAAALGSAPTWLQLYALRPLLIAHGRLSDHAAAGAEGHHGDETGGEPAVRGEPHEPGAGAGPGRAAYGDAELGRRIGDLCDAVLSASDHPIAPHLGVLFGAVLRDEEGARAALLKEVAEPVAEERLRFTGAVGGTPYHDLNEQIVPTVTVIALAELTRRRPTSATHDWFGDDATALAAAALRGEYGRLALLAAVDAAGRAEPQARDELWRNLWRDGRKAPHLQPDLLDALARLWYGHPDTDQPPSVAELEAEAITGDDLALWSSAMRPDSTVTGEFYALIAGHTRGNWDGLAAVLWQAVLWSLAAETDPVETAARLARWWQAPRRAPGTPETVHVGRPVTRAADHIGLLQRVGSGRGGRPAVDGAPIEETTPDTGSTIFSPWMSRWHDGWDHRRKNGPAFRAPAAGSVEPLLRLLAAASLSASLLAVPSVVVAGNDHLVALVFHAVDVLRDEAALLLALEAGEYTGEHPLGPALVSYLWHVHMVLQEAGSGGDERTDPRLFARFALRVLEDDASADLGEGEQFARLARQGIGAISTMWIRRAWVRSSALRPDEGPGRWFLGDPPYALRVLMAVLDRLSVLEAELRELRQQEGRRRKELQRASRDAPDGPERGPSNPGVPLTRGLRVPDLMPAAQLLREIYPGDWPDPVAARWKRLDLDWYRQRDKLRTLYQGHLRAVGGDPDAVEINTVRAERLLLSPVYDLRIWRESSEDLEGWTRVDGAPITMRALRLAALMRDPAAVASEEYHEWIEDWLDRISAVGHHGQLSLDVRAIMIRLMETAPDGAGPDYQRLLASVHEATVDAILEFGRPTPRHVELLLTRLAEGLGVGREATDRLRLRALETIYRQRGYRAVRLDLAGVSGLRRARMARAGRELAIRGFLDRIAVASDDTSERVPVLERARELWERTLVRPSLRGRRAPLADRRLDGAERVPELLVAATVTDHFRAQQISYLLDVLPPEARSGSRNGTRVHDLFPSVEYRRRTIQEIARSERTVFAVVTAVEGDRVWFNAGLGSLLAFEAPAELGLTPGDVVAARLRGSPAAVKGVRRLPRPAPEPGEVRTARVRLARPWLNVRVDGVPGEAYPVSDDVADEVARTSWDPDLSRAFTETAPRSLTVPVRWDADLRHWLPVERSLSELIVDEAWPASGIRLVHAGGELFVTRPGRLYRLTGEAWQDPAAVAELLDGQPAGVILRVTRDGSERSRLRLEDGDDRNVRWRRLFSDTENEVTIATKHARGYSLAVSGPDPFPAEVTVRGAEGGGQRVYVITEPWTDRQARLAEAAVTIVPVSGVADRERPTPERFEEMFSVEAGARVTLRRVLSRNVESAFVLATTSTGVVVRLETDSLTLLDPHALAAGARGLVNGRAADVIRVYRSPRPRPSGLPMAAADLAEHVHTDAADPQGVLGAITEADMVDGVIVARAPAPGRGGGTMYETWCRFGEQVHLVNLDQESLGGTNAELVGQTFTGTRQGTEWTFRFTPREITVRALFTLSDDPADDDRAVFVGSDGRGDLYQAPNRAVLSRRPTAGGDIVRRLKLADAGVTLADRRRIPTRTVVVTARGGGAGTSGGGTLLGVSSFQGDHRQAQISDVRLHFGPASSGGPDLVRVRRVFVLTARARPAPRAPRPVDDARRWQRFLDSGQDHVTGTIAKAHVDVGGGLRPPGPDGTLSERLPLREGEEPAVAGVPYRKIGARFRLVPEGDGYIASYATATPKSVPDFMQLMNQKVTADGVAHPFADALYYVSPPTADLDAHLFEWGYGWTVAVPADRLKVAGSPDRGGLPPLFHGDRVDAASFEAAPDGGDPVMVIAWRDIRPRYVTQIVEERSRQYLHLLDVEVGVATGTLRVLRAQAGRRRGDDPFRGAEWVPFPAALDEASRELIFQRLREAGETGVVRRRILARFDNDTAISTGGRERLFQAVRAGEAGLQDNDRVFLTARRVEETSNELTIIFGIPDVLNADDLVVRVNRREFSFRESTLARLLARGLDVENAEIVMLVRLTAPDAKGVRHGSVNNAPARRPETLVSYLASREGACYAIFGRAERGGGRLELAPGVLYGTDEVTGADQVEHGAVVRLMLDTARRVVLTTALPADRSYVGTSGRPAVVFPKSSLLRRNPAQRRDMGRGFVVSSLPDVQVSPLRPDSTTPQEKGAGAVVLATPHPKICWVWRSRGGGFLLRAARPGEVHAGRLAKADPTRPASLRPRALAGEPRDERDPVTVPWARMSFRNTTARAIATACAAHRWRHHDRSTGHVRDDRLVGPYEVAPGSVMFDGVFFDDDAGWTLRYRPERIGAFGFPAGELLDGPREPRSLAVAGPSADGGGLWVELGPGRIVEVRGALVTADGRSALTGLDWTAFAPGDQVGLHLADGDRSGHGWEAGPSHLVLESWLPSITGALPRGDRNARILLPLRGVDSADGALRLADRRWRLVHPVAVSALPALRDAPAVWLNARNDVEPATAGSVRPGDTLLLGVGDDGELSVHGLPGVQVRIAPRGERNWPGYDWLHQALADERRRTAVLTALDGQLPVTVHTVGVERPVVTVSRERQPSGRWPHGRQVRTELFAALDQRLLLRSGSAVYSVRLDEAVLGVPAELTARVSDALNDSVRSHPLVLWWLVDERGERQAGLVRPGGDASAQNVVVVPEAEVALDGMAAGLVCRDVATARLHWLGAEHASWIQDVAAGDLLANLDLATGRLAARLRPDGSLSITARPAVAHQLRRLQLSQPLRVVLGPTRPQPTDDGRWRYIVRLEMPPVLMSYVSTDPHLAAGTSRLTEVDELDRRGRPAVTVVDVNSRRVTPDLPKWLPAVHRSIVAGSAAAPGDGRFEEYRRWYQEGLPAGGTVPNDAVEGVVRLAGDLVEDDPVIPPEVVRDVTARWMNAWGGPALNLVGGVEMDAAPLLAGAIALDALAAMDAAWARGAVLCLHQLGRRCAASLHTEQIATAWIDRPDRHALGGAWVRLRALSLDTDLGPRELRQLRGFCRAMLTKPALRMAESALAPIARSLLASIGELESGEDLLRDATILAGPATWGRALVPPAGFATAQPELLPSQRAQLRALAEHVINDAVPLTLLPVVASPERSERDLARRLLQELGGAGPSGMDRPARTAGREKGGREKGGRATRRAGRDT